MVYTLKINKDTDLEEFVKTTFMQLDEFYELNWIYNKPKVIVIEETDLSVVNSDKELFRYTGATGWVGNGNVYVVNKDLYAKMMGTDQLEERYKKLIKHELSHCFYQILSKYNSKPDWLWEGCAVYLSEQLNLKTKPEIFTDFLNHFEPTNDGSVYQESGFVVEKLVKTFGKEKLLMLIKGLPENKSSESFDKLFYTTFGFKLSYESINNL